MGKFHNRRLHFRHHTVRPANPTVHGDVQWRLAVHRSLSTSFVRLWAGIAVLLERSVESGGPLHGNWMGEFARCLRGMADVVVCDLYSPDQRRTTAVYTVGHGPGTASAQYGF